MTSAAFEAKHRLRLIHETKNLPTLSKQPRNSTLCVVNNKTNYVCIIDEHTDNPWLDMELRCVHDKRMILRFTYDISGQRIFNIYGRVGPHRFVPKPLHPSKKSEDGSIKGKAVAEHPDATRYEFYLTCENNMTDFYIIFDPLCADLVVKKQKV
jgi:hypothetical protein